MLWRMVKENLSGKDIKELHVENGTVVDCRGVKFGNKTIFSIVVSGNSGSDCVAKQLIGALNINKGFRLPPYFALTATANDPGSIMNVLGIDKKAEEFAGNIKREIRK